MMRIHYAPSPEALNFTGRLLLRRQFHSLPSPMVQSFIPRHLLMRIHCKEIWIYVFSEKELRGLSPNFHIHVPVRDQNRHTNQRNISLTEK